MLALVNKSNSKLRVVFLAQSIVIVGRWLHVEAVSQRNAATTP
jgi:hypothetical protein